MRVSPNNKQLKTISKRSREESRRVPRARLLGGDPLRGGPNVGPGHAGRMSMSHRLPVIVVAVISTLGFLLIAGGTAPASAETGDVAYFYNACTPESYRPETADEADAGVFQEFAESMGLYQRVGDPHKTGIAYCLDNTLGGPGYGKIEYTATETANPGISYILAHGYPVTTTIEGTDYSSGDARMITQIAIWDYEHGFTMNTTNDEQKAEYEVGLALSAEAKEYAQSGGESLGEFWVYTPSTPSAQRIVLCGAVFGKPEIEKKSLDPNVTADNSNYSLAGATFGLYSDESCSTQVATLTTDEEGIASAGSMIPGTYWIKELAAPKGYKLDKSVHKITVEPAQTAKLTVEDGAIYATATALLKKVDSASNAPLGNAEFSVSYYENTKGNAEGTPTRSWTLKTDKDGILRVSQDALVSGDALFTNAAGDVVMPLGTYVIQESKAPDGYLLSDTSSHVIVVSTDKDGNAVVSGNENLTVSDQPVRGGVKLYKIDAQTQSTTPTGKATLEGATIAIRNVSGHAVVVDGKRYEDGEDVITLTTDKNGTCQTAQDALPFGTYEAHETRPSQGYQLNSAWKVRFSITKSSKFVDLQKSALPEKVIRTDLKGVKIAADTEKGMANVPFLVTNMDTGESHVVITNEDGVLDTSSASSPHSNKTNENDKAYNASTGKVDDSMLDSKAGVWFFGTTEAKGSVDDNEGALTYGTYKIEELRSEANAAYDLVTLNATVSKNEATVDLGTISDDLTPVPEIATTLTNAEGDKVVPATEGAVLIDKVHYKDLTAGSSYTLKGELHLVDADGNDEGVIATAEQEFSPSSTESSETITFIFDASQLKGSSVVSFETLYQEEKKVTSHADLDDKGQTVTVPSLSTTLAGDVDHESYAAADQIVLTDTITYHGLEVGKAYTATGTLHLVAEDGSDAGILYDKNGDEVTAYADFTPTASDGSVQVVFTFAAPDNLANQKVVAFESVGKGNTTYATHFDISDTNQTVTFPKIETSASDKSDGDHEIVASKDQVVVDTVRYENLCPGKEYTLKGELHLVNEDGSDGGTLRSAEQAIVPEDADGEASVEFDLDASELAGRTIVVFETLERDGKTVAAHCDLSDQSQTVSVYDEKTPKTSVTAGPTPLPNMGDDSTSALLVGLASLTVISGAGIISHMSNKKKSRRSNWR